MGNENIDLQKIQSENVTRIQKENPELFVTDKIFTEDESYPKIGISTLSPDRPHGYLKFRPEDFIVEEVSLDGKISEIEPRQGDVIIPQEERFTMYADLVKVNLPTFEAINRLAIQLGIAPNKIGYAGVKDAQAVTSQRISMSGINYEMIKDVKEEGFLLTNIFYGKGAVQPSALYGNRFTIFVRTDHEVPQDYLISKLKNAKENGFLNYYQTQRFGGIRLMSHELGKLILQKRYDEALGNFLTQSGEYDIPLLKNIRKECRDNWGNWNTMKEKMSVMPYSFQNEIKVLDHLEKGGDQMGALDYIQDQTTYWIYAYMSYIFNRLLSDSVKNDISLPSEIPLALSNDLSDQKIYEKYLQEDEITDIADAVRPFRFIQMKKRLVPTRIFPEKIKFMSIPEGVVMSFILTKGAYATTFLMNIFHHHQGLPLPEWLKTGECDIKKFLDLGTVEYTKERLEDYFKSAIDYKVGE